MGLYAGLRTVAGADGTGAIDWDAAVEAARAATDPGDVSLSSAQRDGYAADVRAARGAIRTAAAADFDVPETVVVRNRYHWIEANAETFRRLLSPLDERPPRFAGAVRRLNTGSMAAGLAFLARNVLGQYDPLLAVEGGEHELSFVHPNVAAVADDLDVSRERFRRWIAFHEVAHAAEFGAAPWLSDYLAARTSEAVAALSAGDVDLDGGAFAELDAAMTVVEGYAEVLMDRAFDREAADLRAKLDRRRRGGGPVTRALGRVFGVGIKRRQYERGRAFFDDVIDRCGLDAAAAVWERPENLPTGDELDHPDRWLARVQYST